MFLFFMVPCEAVGKTCPNMAYAKIVVDVSQACSFQAGKIGRRQIDILDIFDTS